MPDEMAHFATVPARPRVFALAAAALALVFIVPLWKLARFAAGNDLQSYILLIPLVSFYLAWLQWEQLPRHSAPAKKTAAFFYAAGLGAVVWWFGGHHLPVAVLAFVLFLTGLGCQFLGGATMRATAFSFGLLVFMIPLPDFLVNAIEAALQHGSAEVADWMFTLAGTPLLRGGMNFQLPGMSIQVAPECSGIHSTLVLFITSLVAGRMILRSPWKRAVLALVVIPLALLRNGFRVFVIGELCVHVGPQMIDSPVHHHGGPLFFALSLVPFFLLLYFLKKSELSGATGRAADNKEKIK